ncbi:MAG: hypothetical protein ACM33T_16440 [Solirubrobacterales bacterium]
MGNAPSGTRLSAEHCASALLSNAAATLEAAHDTPTFLAALRQSHSAWLAVGEIACRKGWMDPSSRTLTFALSVSWPCPRVAGDDCISALIDLSTREAEVLAAPHPATLAAERCRLAWGGSGTHDTFHDWLVAKLQATGDAIETPLPNLELMAAARA